MRPYQIFAAMSPELAQRMLRTLAEKAPGAFAQALAVAGAAMKARPVYLRRLPFERRAEAVRRALARVAADDLAEDMLAVYFLECRKELLVEWLDAVGVDHEDGTLRENAPACPPEERLRQALTRFRGDGGEDVAERDLLLRAFSAQRSVDWPPLDALLDEAAHASS